MKTKLIYCLFVSMFFGMFQSSAQSCEGFKTFSQGGWGTQCHGGNPGCYRDAHFNAAFPDGLLIGNSTNSLTLTSSLAVKNFLPSGTTPRALNAGNLVDPGSTYKNVLAGQLVALTLSVGFDSYDANFGSNTTSLGSLTIASGTFAGLTVTQFLQIANNAIGGQSTGYSFSRLNAAASAINENFDGGRVNHGYLTCNQIVVCPPIQITNISAACGSLCYGNQTGHVSITISGGIAPFTYTLSNGATLTSTMHTVTFTGLVAGNYTVTVTDSHNTISTGNNAFTITQPSQLTSTHVQTNATFCTNNNASITVTPAGGTAPYSILWNNGSTTFSVTNLLAGTYTYVVTDANGCHAEGAATITSSEGLNAIHVISNATCFGANNCSISTTVTGGTAPYTILWSNGSTAFSQTGLTPGLYTAVITDARGCQSTTSVTAIEPPVLQLFTVIGTIGTGTNNGSITASATGGTGPYTYLWNNGSTNPVQTNLAPGLYTCTVTDGSQCSTTLSARILIATCNLLATAVVTNVSCFGGNNGSLVVTPSAGTAPYTILWANGSTSFTISNLIAGTYTATVTDATGCSVTTSGTVTQPLVLSTTYVRTNATCCTGNNGTITVTPTSGTAPYTILWSNAATTFSLDNLVAGTYTYVVTDAHGCTTNGSVLIRALPSLASTYISTPATCTNNNGSITVTASGGTAPYTILWANGSTTFALTNLTNGTYAYTITDANGCQTNQVVNLVPLTPTLVSTYVTTLATCAGNDASITVTATGGIAPYIILWSDGSTTFTIGELAAGTYTYTVTDANGCTTNGSVTIQAIPNLNSIHVTTNASCNAANNCSISTTVTGGTAPYTILWSNGSTSFSQTNLAAGTYTAVITDANGCHIDTSVTVTEPPVLVLSRAITSVNCASGATGAITASAVGGTPPYTFLWNNGSTNPTQTNLIAGTYTCVATDGHGCSATLSALVTQADPIAITNTITNVSCFAGTNGSVTITATGGTAPYTILWTGGATTFTRANLTAGTYTAVITDTNGCTSNVSATITQPATALASTNTTTNVSCFAGTNGSVTVTATGGTSPYTILWSNGGTTFTANNLAAGTYTAVITDAHGCTSNVSVTITQPATALASTNTTTNVSCFAGSNGSVTVTATGGTAPYTILWTGGATTFTRANLLAGTYTAVITDAHGCTSNVSVTITQPATAFASTNATTNVSCFAGTNGSVTVTATGGTAPYTILWTGGATTFTRANLLAGTYAAVITDAHGCTSNVSVTITQPATALAYTNTTTNVSCFAGTNGSVTVTATGGTAPYTILWSTGGTTFTASNLIVGTYTAVITDAHGCTSNVSAILTQPATALASTQVVVNSSCLSDTNGSITVTASGGTAPYTILWSNGSTNFIASNFLPGTYTAVITDAHGCTTNVSATLTLPIAVVATTTHTNVSCFSGNNGSATATVTSGNAPYTILWSNGSTTFTASDLLAGTYTAVITSANGCTTNVSATITQPATALSYTMSQTPITTSGGYGTATVTATGGTAPYTYSWDSTPIQTTQTATLQVGWYIVTVTDANGCTINGEVVLLFGYCTGFKTVSQSGYNATCNDENASCYLNTNFATTFPNGIVVGSGTRYLKFTSAEAIHNFLPANSTARALNQGTILNPSSSTYNNGLAAQVATTLLNIGFGKNHDFSATDVSLGDLFITSGVFEGMKVSEVVTIANTILGNGTTTYNINDVSKALIAINSNYEAGTDMEFLRCTGRAALVNPILGTELVSYMVYPNPIKDNATIEYTLNNNSSVSIKLYNVTGQLVNTIFDGKAEAGEKYTVKFNVDGMKSGVYFMKLTTNNNVVSKSVIISQQ